jgi:replicative DNA helicase
MNQSPIIPFPQRDANNRPASREKLTPQSLEAEQSTLGAMLMERDAVARAVELLTPDDFYRELHKKIYKSVLKLFDKGEPIDIVTVAEELRRNGQLDDVGGSEYLSALIEACPSSANIDAYANVVGEKSVLRQLVKASDEIAGWAYADGTDEVSDLVDRSEKRIFEIGSRRLRAGFTHIKPLLMTAYDQIERQFQHKGEATGISTGFTDLDDITSGLQPTDFVILAARPSMGKTALVLNIAHHIALKERQPVAVFSLEMSKEQLVQRLICSEAASNHRICGAAKCKIPTGIASPTRSTTSIKRQFSSTTSQGKAPSKCAPKRGDSQRNMANWV